MNRLLSLDIGTKTIGVAITDESHTLVTPLPPIIRNAGSLRLGPLKKLIAKYQVKEIITGLPIHLQGQSSAQTKVTKAFVNKLKKHFTNITFHLVDERLSTETVKLKYKHLNLKKDNSSRNIDSFSAMEILEDYLKMGK